MIVPLFEGKVPVFLSEIGIMRMWILPLHQFQGNDDSEECFTAIVKSARRKASVGSRSVADAFAYAASHDQDACVVSQASIQAGREAILLCSNRCQLFNEIGFGWQQLWAQVYLVSDI